MDKVAIVTGAGSGIGKYTAIALCRDGFHVFLAGRSIDTLEATKADAASAARCFVVETDVRDEESVATLFAAAEERFGRVDLLFNNAGINVPSSRIDGIELDAWKNVVETNLTGMFLCAREAFRLMLRQNPSGGRIINNGSISAHTPRPGSAPYTATKHAVSGLTKSIQLDGRDVGIVASQIDIGNASTNMTERMSQGVPQADGSMKPEPVIDVKHVADLIAFQASLPLNVNLPFATIMANQMPYVGRG